MSLSCPAHRLWDHWVLVAHLVPDDGWLAGRSGVSADFLWGPPNVSEVRNTLHVSALSNK